MVVKSNRWSGCPCLACARRDNPHLMNHAGMPAVVVGVPVRDPEHRRQLGELVHRDATLEEVATCLQRLGYSLRMPGPGRDR